MKTKCQYVKEDETFDVAVKRIAKQYSCSDCYTFTMCNNSTSDLKKSYWESYLKTK